MSMGVMASLYAIMDITLISYDETSDMIHISFVNDTKSSYNCGILTKIYERMGIMGISNLIKGDI